MNLFQMFFNLTHPPEKWGWVETTAYFTGDARKAMPKGRVGFYYHDQPADYNEYGIRYYADDSERLGWYRFYPSPDPEPEELKGKSVRIRYKKSRPWNYEFVSDYEYDFGNEADGE